MKKIRVQGFTLIEMTIVLVIIGLVVGGILAGQYLISAAAVRATISQKDRFDSALNTFYGKYSCIPGDCANGAQFGLHNGKGKGTLPNNYDDDEYKWFWRDLSTAHLIADYYPGQTNFAGDGGAATVAGFHSPTCPICVMYTGTLEGGGGLGGTQIATGGWFVSDFGNITADFSSPAYKGPGGVYPLTTPAWNWMLTQGNSSGTYGGVTASPNVLGILIPAQAMMIDQKLDDGLPLTGSFVVMGSTFTDTAGGVMTPNIQHPDNTWINSGTNTYLPSNNTVGLNAVWRAGF